MDPAAYSTSTQRRVWDQGRRVRLGTIIGGMAPWVGAPSRRYPLPETDSGDVHHREK